MKSVDMDVARVGAHITHRAAEMERKDHAESLPTDTSALELKPPAAIDFAPSIDQPVIPEKREREPVNIARTLAT